MFSCQAVNWKVHNRSDDTGFVWGTHMCVDEVVWEILRNWKGTSDAVTRGFQAWATKQILVDTGLSSVTVAAKIANMICGLSSASWMWGDTISLYVCVREKRVWKEKNDVLGSTLYTKWGRWTAISPRI